MSKPSNEKLILDHPIVFTTLAGQSIPAQLQEIRLFADGDSRRCTLRLELGSAAFLDIVEGEWFALHPAAIGGLTVSSFDLELPVELQLLLRKGIAEQFLQETTSGEDIIKALLNPSTDDMNVKLYTSENWLATEIKQEMSLPEELADEGKLKHGFRTQWAEASRSSSSAATAAIVQGDMHETVDQLLSGWNWSFLREDPELLSVKFSGETGQWTVLIATDEEKSLCLIYSIYPVKVPEARRSQAMDWMTETNYNLPIGCFEMDLTDGELRFRSGIDVEQDRLSRELLSNLLTTNMAVMDMYFAELAQLIE
ncbi:YbjN domain-containing protein [Paenibacillus sinopodophylli]|uniref:YbjN domain-containing protein n=1 Tax=Paenibacillus sinopodophylli TaxID=1837342 RepID=UPI0014871FE0|nr:YbjN domain-containing protein [Paenibacillus sinopodophylli]